MTARDAIAAIATAPGRAAIGIVRVSGPDLNAMAASLVGAPLTPRRAVHAVFRQAAGDAIDEGLALYFRSPHSYTGEDVLELHGHGGPVVLRMLLERCCELGARVAEPGEFTRRAYLNGKLDLVQAEGVIDLIDASTEHAARSALRSLQGEFSHRIRELESRLIELRALVEAMLDFPEDDVDVLDQRDAHGRLERLRIAADAVLTAARRGSLLREGMHVVLAGRPNVGKSSLLNRLAGRDVAIVTDVPGTTRDVIREPIDVGGVPLHILDTAGLRESSDPVERIGVERAWGAIGNADLVVLLLDTRLGLQAEERAMLARVSPSVPVIQAMNKIDLVGRLPAVDATGADVTVWLSARTGAGVDLLSEAMLARVGWTGAGEGVFLARARHLSALDATRNELARGAESRGAELLAEHLRRAHDALATITGEYAADDLLGEIFQRFCIGK